MKTPLLILLGCLLLTSISYGQPTEDQQEAANAKLREALRSTMAQLRAVETEKSTLQATQSGLEEKVAKLQKERDATTLKAAQDKDLAQAALDELNAALQKRKGEVTELTTALQKWEAAYKNVAEAGSSAAAQRSALAERVTQLEREVEARERNNLELYQVGSEILERYENFGFGRALTAREPFTGIARVKLENQVQAYKDKLLDHRDKMGEPTAQPQTSVAKP